MEDRAETKRPEEKQVLKNNLEEQLREEEMRSSAEKKLDRTLDALELAGEHLKDAAHGMSDRFGEQLNRHASEILSEITDGKYGRLFGGRWFGTVSVQ